MLLSQYSQPIWPILLYLKYFSLSAPDPYLPQFAFFLLLRHTSNEKNLEKAQFC